MRINNIQLYNFRGFQGHKEFDFKNNPLVLLSAPNGLGKTSLIDGIEWALTGSIGRLLTAFDTRSPNAEERKKNTAGILKNEYASSQAEVRVQISFSDSDNQYVLVRYQKKDVLDVNASSYELTVNGVRKNSLLQELINKDFYAHHFCDVQKSLNIQTSRRSDLMDIFKEFIADYSDSETVIANLILFAEDAERYAGDKELELLEIDKKIAPLAERIQQAIENRGVTEYPKTVIVDGEKVEIEELSEDELIHQKQLLTTAARITVKHIAEFIIANSKVNEQLSMLIKLERLFEEKKIFWEQAAEFDYDFDEINSKIERLDSLEQSIKVAKEYRIKDCNQYLELVSELHLKGFPNIDYDKYTDLKYNLESQIDKLQEEIALFSRGDVILTTMTALFSQKDNVLKYRSTVKSKGLISKCPICGSTDFNKLSDSMILSEAESYLKENKEHIEAKNSQIKSLQSNIEKSMLDIAGKVDQLLEDSTQSYNLQKNRLKSIYLETKEIRSIFDRLASIYDVSDLKNTNFISEQIEIMSKKLVSPLDIQSKRITIQELLEIIDDKPSCIDNEFQLIREMNQYSLDGIAVKDCFSKDLLSDKLAQINILLKDKKQLGDRALYRKLCKQRDDIQTNINYYKNLSELAKSRSQRINDSVTALVSDEYQTVGPYLNQFYRKLSRISNIDEIRISAENNNISLVDGKCMNIVNILSNGQISVFMLAYFFAGLLARASYEPFKVYFIDDLTACLDDINMLSFLDMIKYQLKKKGSDIAIEQLFFVSCDERICELLKYKMKGCGVNYCELEEKDFV